MIDVFISYSRNDLDRVRVLASALEASGLDIFWDRDLLAGESFDQAIRTALDGSKCLVVVWSESSVGSDWVKDEASVAKQRNVLVPIRIDDVPIPLGFGRVHTADLLDWDGDTSDLGFVGLQAAIARIAENADSAGVAPGAAPTRTITTPPPKKLPEPEKLLGMPRNMAFGVIGAVVLLGVIGIGVALSGGGTTDPTTAPTVAATAAVTTQAGVAQGTVGTATPATTPPTTAGAVGGIDCAGFAYCDDFLAIDNGWPTVVDAAGISAYHPATFYHVEPRQTDVQFVVLSGQEFDDATVETVVHVEFTDEENPFVDGSTLLNDTEGAFRAGIVLRATDDGRFLMFSVLPLLNDSGTFWVWLFRSYDPAALPVADGDFTRVDDRAWLRPLAGSSLETRASGLRAGFIKHAEQAMAVSDIAEPVTLAVKATGDTFELFVNGTSVDTITVEGAPASGDVGFYVETLPGQQLAHIHYDSLTVAV